MVVIIKFAIVLVLLAAFIFFALSIKKALTKNKKK
jgi:hypothetical protein